MKVSGKEVADEIAKKLQKEVSKLKEKPTLAIVLAGDNPASRIYVKNKIKRATEIGIQTKFFEFSNDQFADTLETIQILNKDKSVHGILVQFPPFSGWNFDEIIATIDPKKDVDGFGKESPYSGATALGAWEMLAAFARLEGFSSAEEFLKGKNIVLLGKGRAAGGPTRDLLQERGIRFTLIDSKTQHPDQLIKEADVIISATGRKNIITGDKIKEGSYVIGVGVGKELVDQEEKVFGDIEESTVSQKAKLYCPTIGGIGPLTIVSLLRNVVESAYRSLSS